MIKIKIVPKKAPNWCPNCKKSPTTFSEKNGMWVCNGCGYSFTMWSAPAGVTFSDYLGRRQAEEVCPKCGKETERSDGVDPARCCVLCGCRFIGLKVQPKKIIRIPGIVKPRRLTFEQFNQIGQRW